MDSRFYGVITLISVFLFSFGKVPSALAGGHTDTVPKPASRYVAVPKTPDEKWEAVAVRLTKVMGRPVKLSTTRDANGVPHFEIQAGSNRDEAEGAIDKLVEARNAAGMDVKQLPFRGDRLGNVLIFGNDIVDLKEGAADPFVKLAKLEDAKISAKLQDSFTAKMSNEQKFQVIAARMAIAFGRAVTVSEVRDFNGVPSFEIKSGKDRAGADAIIDNKLIALRTDMGLDKSKLPFGSDRAGNIVIYGGPIMNYGAGKSDVIDSTFEKLENPAWMKKIQAAFE